MKPITIGILGGGQLARMSAFQAYKLGLNVSILEKNEYSPAGSLTKNEFIGWIDNENIIKNFAESCDIVTLENEFIDFEKLELIEKFGKKVIPSPKTISLIQDKFIQKKTLSENKIPVPQFLEVTEEMTYKEISKYLGKKFILKSKKLGYDGYGNAAVNNKEQFVEAVKKLSKRHNSLLAEKFIKFSKELAIMVVRTEKEIKTYPVVETIQKDHICHTVIAKADISKKIEKKVKEIAIKSVKAVEGFGLFGIELFLTIDNEILVNEMAPRPHNSGHYTIEACVTSQFENHIRSVLNLPLGSTKMIKPSAVMINLLGKKEGDGVVENYDKALNNPDIHLHIYGKQESRLGRKMGHITLLGKDKKKILREAKKIEKQILI